MKFAAVVQLDNTNGIEHRPMIAEENLSPPFSAFRRLDLTASLAIVTENYDFCIVLDARDCGIQNLGAKRRFLVF